MRQLELYKGSKLLEKALANMDQIKLVAFFLSGKVNLQAVDDRLNSGANETKGSNLLLDSFKKLTGASAPGADLGCSPYQPLCTGHRAEL